MVCRHMPPAPGGPRRARAVRAEALKFLPVGAAVGRVKQRGVFHAGVDGVPIGQRRLEVPHALEFPRMRRAVVPLVRAGHAFVDELVAHRRPRLPAIVRSLDDLTEPAGGLGRVQTIGIHRGSFDVINLPPAEVRTAHVPLLTLAVRGQDERALPCADQYANSAHRALLLSRTVMFSSAILSIGWAANRQSPVTTLQPEDDA